MDSQEPAPAGGVDCSLRDTMLLDLGSPRARHGGATKAETPHAPLIAERATEAVERDRAWRSLFREQTLLTVRRWLSRLCVDGSDLHDATQVVMLEVHKSFRTYDPRLAPPERWLYRIALHVASKFQRKARRRNDLFEALADDEDEELDIADESPGPDDALCDDADRQLLYLALDQVPLDVRLVLIRRDLDALSMEEIAEMYRIPVSTAYKRRARALAALKAAATELQAMDDRC